MTTQKVKARAKRKKRIKAKIFGTASRPRMSVFRSNQNIYVQLIDDMEQKVVTASSTIDKELKGKFKNNSNTEAAKAVGEHIAKKALKKNIKEVVFDRNGYLFHGKVKALAEAARAGGLKF